MMKKFFKPINPIINYLAIEQIMKKMFHLGFVLLLLFSPMLLFGQDIDSGVTAIEEAANGIEGYFAPIETIIYVIAGILALFGIMKVYTKFQMGDPGVMTAAISWFGSAIFLVVAITIIKSFFDIG